MQSDCYSVTDRCFGETKLILVSRKPSSSNFNFWRRAILLLPFKVIQLSVWWLWASQLNCNWLWKSRKARPISCHYCSTQLHDREGNSDVCPQGLFYFFTKEALLKEFMWYQPRVTIFIRSLFTYHDASKCCMKLNFTFLHNSISSTFPRSGWSL